MNKKFLHKLLIKCQSGARFLKLAPRIYIFSAYTLTSQALPNHLQLLFPEHALCRDCCNLLWKTSQYCGRSSSARCLSFVSNFVTNGGFRHLTKKQKMLNNFLGHESSCYDKKPHKRRAASKRMVEKKKSDDCHCPHLKSGLFPHICAGGSYHAYFAAAGLSQFANPDI